MEKVAIEVSDVILGPPTEADAILRRPAGTVTVTRQSESRNAPHAFMNAVVFTCAEELQDIPEPTMHALSTTHPGRLHLPSITLPTIILFHCA